jgi:biotin carboxylase
VIAAADLAVLFGLPSPGALGIRGCRDKALCRERLSAAGIAQPASRYCPTLDAALAFARELSFPLVVKPRGMGGSIGVSLVADEAALRARFAEADAASRLGAAEFHNGAILETYLDGPEISVDGSVVDGRYTPLFVARKSVGLPPFFEELGHVVDHADPLSADAALRETLVAAHRAIGFENGVTHTELKAGPDGWTIIEINGRLGGDLIPFLATLATGIEPGLLAGQIACGDAVGDPVAAARGECAAIWFRYPDVDEVAVERIVLPDPVTAAGAGDTASTSPGREPDRAAAQGASRRAGYAIAVGAAPDACLALSRDLAARIAVEARSPRSPPSETDDDTPHLRPRGRLHRRRIREPRGRRGLEDLAPSRRRT